MDLGSRAPATAARRRLNRSRASHPLTVNQAYAQRVPKHRSLSSDGMRTSSARTCPENGLDRSLDCPENGLDRSLDRSLAPPAPRSPTRRLAPLAWIRMRPQQRRGEARVPRDESHGSIWIGVTERVVARPTRCLSGVYPMLWRTPIPFLGLPVAVDRSCRSAAGPLLIPGLLLVKHDDRILPKPHGERRHTRFGPAGRTIEGGRHTVAPQQSACRPAADDLPGQEFDPTVAFEPPPPTQRVHVVIELRDDSGRPSWRERSCIAASKAFRPAHHRAGKCKRRSRIGINHHYAPARSGHSNQLLNGSFLKRSVDVVDDVGTIDGIDRIVFKLRFGDGLQEVCRGSTKPLPRTFQSNPRNIHAVDFAELPRQANMRFRHIAATGKQRRAGAAAKAGEGPLRARVRISAIGRPKLAELLLLAG